MGQRKIAVFDCETDPFLFGRKPEPFLVGYYDGEKYLAWRDPKEFVEFVKTQNVICFAHNGGKFDFLYLIAHLGRPTMINGRELREGDTKIFLINERLVSFKLGLCEMRDSYTILPVPLKAYKKDEISYDLFEKDKREKPENLKQIADYLRSDCKYLYELIKAYREKSGTSLTLAANSINKLTKIMKMPAPDTSAEFMNFWKNGGCTCEKNNTHKVPCNHCGKFGWYYGGRVEVFKPGVFENTPIQVGDINSAYSKAMMFDHPYGPVFRRRDRLPSDRETLSRCFLEIETQSLGAFPIPTKENGLWFPNDGKTRNFKITGWEYIAAQETSTIGNKPVVRAIYCFDDKINFKPYVDEFFQMKLSAPKESADYLIAKLYLNAPYGKLGQDSRNFEEYFLVPQQEVQSKEVEYSAKLTDFVGPWALISRPTPPEKQKFYNVATAASITGWVRGYLWKNICASKNVFYCDTDCIHASQLAVPIGDQLGEWKLEFQSTRGAYAGKKLYALQNQNLRQNPGEKNEDFQKRSWKFASKGFSPKTPEEIFDIARGKEIEYCRDAPSASLKGGWKFTKRTIRRTATGEIEIAENMANVMKFPL